MNGPSTRIPFPRVSGERAGGPIVVGVDGSEPSLHALAWALEHAASLGRPVEVVTVWPIHAPVFVREVGGHFCEPRWRAARVQADTVARALAEVSNPPAYALRLENAEVIDALVTAAGPASLLVLGTDRTEQTTDSPAWVYAHNTPLTVLVQRRTNCPVVLVADPATSTADQPAEQPELADSATR